MLQTIQDAEFGTITVRRSRLARHIKLKVDQQGRVVVSMPVRAPLFMAKALVGQSRPQVRQHIAKAADSQAVLQSGDIIGKTHRLAITAGATFGSRLQGTELQVTIPPTITPDAPAAQRFIKQAALKALRTQARAYLSRRLRMLGEQGGFAFSSVRFSNAGTRWGSCSTTGTISLNIWLMQLPFELIDYVLVHELCHTRHMDHSPAFWAAVEQHLPEYREHRKALKLQRPYL